MNATATVETEKKMTAIEAALAAARARKAQREAAGPDDGDLSMDSPQPKRTERTKTLNEKVTADKSAKAAAAAAAKAEKETARAAAKAQRDAEREQRRAAKAAAAANKKATHMSKVERAGARLPALVGDFAKNTYEDIVSNLGVDQINAMAMHLQHVVRTKMTQASMGTKLAPGQKVTIVTSADPRFIGAEGTIEKAQRIRCFVNVPGSKKPVYLFTSDVKVIA